MTLFARVRAPSPSAAGYVPSLDGLRGIAILVVIAFHCATLLEVTFQITPATPVAFLAQGGWVGVTLFFVLSGYLITGILLDTRRRRAYFRNFYGRRFLRIFPMYYAVLVLVLFVLPRINVSALPVDAHTPYWPSFFLYVTNIFVSINQNWLNYYLDPTWSLAIEEQFYLVWPLMIWLLSPRAVARVCVALVGLAVVWRVGLVLAGADSLGIYVLSPSHVDSLAIGSWLAVRARDAAGLRALRPRLPLVLAGATLMLIAVLVAQRSLVVTDTPMQIAGYTAFALLSAVLLASALISSETGPIRRVLELSFLRTVGHYSYAVYLLHELCGMLAVNAIVEHPGIPRELLIRFGPTVFYGAFYLGVVGVSFAAAWCSWHLLERHFLAMKRFFSFDTPVEVRAAASVSPSPVVLATN